MSSVCNIDGCSAEVLAKGFCTKHYWRNHRHGSPLSKPSMDGAPLDWLLLHRDWVGEECLPWPFAHNAVGYGSVLFDGAVIGAHRAMCILARGPAPTLGHQAAHSCGNGHLGCVNPRHLDWATPKKNAEDKALHREKLGRMGNAKLTDAQCQEIIRLSATTKQSELARRFRVSPSLVCRLLSGQRRGLAKSAHQS